MYRSGRRDLYIDESTGTLFNVQLLAATAVSAEEGAMFARTPHGAVDSCRSGRPDLYKLHPPPPQPRLNTAKEAGTGVSRCEIWQMLLGYRPLNLPRRAETMAKKRREYFRSREQGCFSCRGRGAVA